MKRFVQGRDRTQGILLPEQLDDYVTENNPVRIVDAFVNELDLGKLDFKGITPADTGRPAYHPSVLLKIYIYGYLNRIQDRKIMSQVPDDQTALNKRLGIAAPDKVGGNYQEAIQYPSLNVRGMAAGAVGEKVASIIPDKAVAELDLRTTVEADADYLFHLLSDYVMQSGYVLIDHEPTDADRANHSKLAQLKRGKADDAERQEIETPIGHWSLVALQTAHGQNPVRLRQMGATVPTAELVVPLGMPFILVPTVNADDNQHTYDENLRMGNFLSGMKSMLGLLVTPF